MAKKETELNPKIEAQGSNSFIPNTDSELPSFGGSMMFGGDSEDTFFKNAFNKLFDERNPETKTEYRNVEENFEGAVLSFLGNYGNIPYLADFVEQFERKRISLERKGRKEIIMAMVEREKEMQRQNALKMGGMLMGNV